MEYIYILLALNLVLICALLVGVFWNRGFAKASQELQQLKNDLATNNSNEFAKSREMKSFKILWINTSMNLLS